MTRLMTTLPAIVLAGGLAGSALAQQAPERKLEGSFDQPLTDKAPPTRGNVVTSRVIVVERDGEHEYELTIEGDNVSAKIDGEAVPAERLRRSGSRVELLDAEGKVVKAFVLPRSGRFLRGLDRDAPLLLELEPFLRQPEGDRPATWEPPPVMLGINMSAPDPAVLEHLGIESGIRVDRVVEGLPADKAGIKVGDVIVAVDDKSPATPEMLRETLKNKKPGDTLTLKVMRKGSEHTMSLELVAFDAERLGMPSRTEGQRDDFWRGFNPDDRGGVIWSLPEALNSPEVRRKIEDAREELRKAIERLRTELADQNIEGKARAALERLVEQLSRIRDEMREQARALRQGPDPLRFRQPVAPEVPAVPGVPSVPEAVRGVDRDRELAELRRQNQELREQLEKMNARFDELMKRLDEMSKRGG